MTAKTVKQNSGAKKNSPSTELRDGNSIEKAALVIRPDYHGLAVGPTGIL